MMHYSMPALMAIPALMSVLLSGCYIGDFRGHETDPCWDDCYTDIWDTGDWNDNDDGDGFWVEPNEIAAGDTIIASIVSDGQVNFETVVEVTFFGEVEVITTNVRSEWELLVTIHVGNNAATGPVDVMVEHANGDVDFLDDALAITPGNPNQPDDEDNPCG
ncbi:MAG: hypothetical protein HN348_34230 [Proteobacteria bacterium]|jgi:hypothetical protein|nr:hypothetical protein [Pseudomonadota bacterium]